MECNRDFKQSYFVSEIDHLEPMDRQELGFANIVQKLAGDTNWKL